MTFLPAPFDQPYLVRALLELALLAPIAGALGVLVVLRRQVFTAHAIGVGALLISAGVGGSGARIDGLLFGTLIGITDADLVRAAIIFTVTVIALLGLGRVWAFAAFDPSAATMSP